VEAAALPLAGLTAWQMLVDTAGVGAGTRVLVLGAAGGVGHLAVQIAKAYGAWVAATASTGKHAFLAGLGADERIDYQSEAVAERVRGADLVVDCVGGETGLSALPALRDGGLLLTVSGSAVGPLREAAGGRVRVAGILVEPDRAGLEGLVGLGVRPHVERTFPLEGVARAHELGETGRTRGKLVLNVG
jgi:NADPH:quinone reductase-like Zn-dependent oxidoreductase